MTAGNETRLGQLVRWLLGLALLVVIVIAIITGCDAYMANPAWDPLGLRR